MMHLSKPGIAAVTLSVLFLLALTTPAEARYYGSHYSIGYGHHGRHHGGHLGIHFRHGGHHGHSYYHHGRHHHRGFHQSGHYYKPYRYHRYHYRPHYYHKNHHGYYHNPLYKLLAAPAYLAYGILKIPATIIGSLTGSYHHSGHHYYQDGNDAGYTNHDGDASRPETTTPDKRNSSGPDQPQSSMQSSDEHAWDLLTQGHYPEALREFGKQAIAQPRKGVPKVGYALAAAAGGDLDRGSWAIQRALKYDPDALHYLQLEGKFQSALAELIGRYRAQLEHPSAGQQDAVVMLATLHYLSGDKPAAREVIDTARPQPAGYAYEQLERLLETDTSPGPEKPSDSSPDRNKGMVVHQQ